MSNEPYESLPEGEPHAVADWITRIVAGVLLALIIALAAACPAKAAPGSSIVIMNAHSLVVARNWCGEYADGYMTGYCWTQEQCDYVPPVVCPAPVSDSEDPYMTGLRDGLAAGRVEI